MNNLDNFLEVAISLNPNIEDMVDALEWGLSQVPKVNEYVWLGEIRGLQDELLGVYYGDSRESRWFPSQDLPTVAKLLVEEMT